MTANTNLGALIGSLRVDSYNRALFGAAAALLAPDVGLTEISLRDVPFYDGDVEAVGDPDAVRALKQAVEASNGLIIFTPEYNRGVPAVIKNAIDWLSRTPGDSALSRSTVGIVAATPGRHDASGVRAHLAQSIESNTDRFFPTTLGISNISGKLTDGVLTDQHAAGALVSWLTDFVAFAEESRHG